MALNRCLVTPVNMGQSSFSAGGTLPQAAPTYGIDAAGTGGTAFATTWASGGPYTGIMFPNNGQCWVYIYCGATLGGVVQLLQGRKVEGQLPGPATFGPTLAATTTYFLPPMSPQDFNQQDATAYGGGTAPGGGTAALGGAIGTSGVGLTCIDFTTTTTLAVRVYQVSQVSP